VAGLTFNGGSGGNTIDVQATQAAIPVTINPGSGVNSIVFGNTSNTLSDILGPVTVNGGASDTLTFNDSGYASPRTWAITDTTGNWGGPVVTYSGLAGVAVNGGSGGNTFTVSASSPTAAITLDGGSGNSQLTGSSSGNLWQLSGSNAGSLSAPAYGSGVSFTRVQNLTSGGGGDTFQFADGASIAGNLSGGGSDTLDYSLYTTSVTVDLQLSPASATGVGGAVSGITRVIGGSGAPGSPGLYNLLIGNGGATLQGGTGRRNILVAGGAASTLIAGDGEDLLIGGSTAYDTDPALTSWQQIAAYWAGTDDYGTRVGNLTTGNGVPLLDPTTVTGNGGGNTLTGNGALALLYTDGADNITGFDPSSQQVAITP
jgi:hypothetical protein